MRNIHLAVITAGLAVICTTTDLSASPTIGVLPDSAEGQATVGGSTANLSDPSTARANPANMTKITEREWQLNMAVWDGNINFNPVGAQSISLLDGILPVGSAFMVTPVNDRLWFGLGLSSPFGLSYDHQEFTSLRYIAPHEAMLMTADISPSIAYKVNDQLSIGLGLDFMYSKLDMKQSFPWAALTLNPATPDGEFHFEADGWGIGGFGGVNWEFAPGHRLAAIGRLPIEVEYKGNFTAGGFPAPLAAAGFSHGSNFESAIKFPGMFGIGYGVDVNDKLTLGADFGYFFNESHESIPLMIGNNQPLLFGSQGLNLNWQNNFDLGASASYKLNECLTLRSGYMYSSNSVPDATYTPSVPTNTRHIGSVGIGYEKGIHALDFSYSVIHFPDRTVTGNETPAFNGDYSYIWQIFNLSYGRKF